MQHDSYEDWCVHYRGLGHPFNVPLETVTCKAGVRYLSVEVDDWKGARTRLDRLPCFKHNGITTCPHARFRTPEEVAAKHAEVAAAIDAWVDKLNNDICPECDTPIARQRQVGRCVYADPCGHRLFQGTAKQDPPPEPRPLAPV